MCDSFMKPSYSTGLCFAYGKHNLKVGIPLITDSRDIQDSLLKMITQ